MNAAQIIFEKLKEFCPIRLNNIKVLRKTKNVITHQPFTNTIKRDIKKLKII